MAKVTIDISKDRKINFRNENAKDDSKILFINRESPVMKINEGANHLFLTSKITKENYICLVYSRSCSEITVGSKTKRLDFGGFFSFNAKNNASLTFASEDTMAVLLIFPHKLLPSFVRVGIRELYAIPSFYIPIVNDLMTSFVSESGFSNCKIVTAMEMLCDWLEEVKENAYNGEKNDYHKALELIEKNIEYEDMSLDFLASKLYFSRSKTQKLFFDNNTTFRNELRRVRIKKICLKIQNNPYVSLEQAVFDVGYKNISSADKIFKKEKGISISKYRKIIRADVERLFHANKRNL